MAADIKRNCPYCIKRGLTEDTKQHLWIHPTKGIFHCWRCGASGKKKGTRLILPPPGSVRKPEPSDLTLFTFSLRTKESRDIFQYLREERGLPASLIRREVRWSPDMPYRAIFPAYAGDELVCIQGRSIKPNEKVRYLTYGKGGECVFRFERVEGWAVLTEGPLDALATPHGISTFGKDVTDTQLRLITSKYSKLYLALDPDAKSTRDKIESRLRGMIDVVSLDLPDGEDPSSLGYRYMKELIDE